MKFQILAAIFFGQYVAAGIIKPEIRIEADDQISHDISYGIANNCDNVKGSCCHFGKYYKPWEISLERTDNGKCNGYMCMIDKMKSIGEIKCGSTEKTFLEANKALERIVEIVKSIEKDGYIGANLPQHGDIQLDIKQKYDGVKEKRGLTTPLPTMTTTTTMTTTHPTGCYDYSLTTGRSGNWCYGTYCNNGQVIHWDNFNCGTTRTTTPPITSTPPMTSTPRTTTPFYFTPLYCVYNDKGQYTFHQGGSSFMNLDGASCKCTFYGRVQCEGDHVVG